MKRLYRIFKSECPSGLITEEVFHNIFSKFFPLGAESYNGENLYIKINLCVHSTAAGWRSCEMNFVLKILCTKSAVCIPRIWFEYSMFQSTCIYFIFAIYFQPMWARTPTTSSPHLFRRTQKLSHLRLCSVNTKDHFKLSLLQDFVVGLSVLVNGSQVIMKWWWWWWRWWWMAPRRRSWSGRSTFTTWTGTGWSPGRRWRTWPCRSVQIC